MGWDAVLPIVEDVFAGDAAAYPAFQGGLEALGGGAGTDALTGAAGDAVTADSMTAPTQAALDSTAASPTEPGGWGTTPGDQILPPSVTPPQDPSSWWDSILNNADSAATWMEKHKMATMMGLGLGLGGLNAYGAAQAAKRNQQFQQQALAEQRARQAQQDYPAPYTGMNIQPPTQTDFPKTAVMNPLALRNYGANPEMRFFGATGGLPGLPAHHIPHGAFDLLSHEGGGQEDNIPAMLSPKEYVLDADLVSALGDGNPDEGAKKLDHFREKVRAHKRGAPTSRIPPKAKPIESYMREAA